MKKILLLSIICILAAASLFSAQTRSYTQMLVTPTMEQFPDVTNGANSTNPNYTFSAYNTARPSDVLSTATHPYQALRVSRFGNGIAIPYATVAVIQFSYFGENWTMGETIHFTITNNTTMLSTSWDLVIPDNAGTAIGHRQTINPFPTGIVCNLWPVSDTYTLNVNGPDGYAVTGPVNGTTDYVATDDNAADLAGSYTIAAAPVGFHWVVNPIVVAAGDFTAAKAAYTHTIEFALEADPDTYTYNLNVTGPDGYAVTGPVNGTTDYLATDDNSADLIGDYTIAAAPAGFHWVTNPITVTADMFVAAKSAANLKAIQGSRNNGSKVNYVYNATIEFVLEADVIPDTWTYNLQVNGPDGYAVTGPVNGTTDYLAVDDDDNVNELVGDYTIAAAPAGFHWQTNPITVTADMFVAAKVDHVYNATIEFVLVENVIDPTNPPMGVVVTPGGNNGMPGTDGGLPATIYTIAASGVWDVVVNKPAGFGYPWYAFINTIPMLASGPIMVDTYTFMNVNFGAKAPLVVTLDDDEALTLPVELSYFAATLTAQNFVKLTWVSQSETGLLGYRVYRSENNDQASAISITPSMIPATNTSTTQTYSITDAEVAIGSTYYYWLESVDMGHSTFFGPTSVLVQGEVPPVLPEYTTMRNAYPNPFRANTGTTIEVNVKAGETGQVTVYNVLGQVVKTYTVKEGLNNLNWNGKDSKGNVCGSGIYFYKLSTPSMNMTKKMVIVK